MTRDPADDTGGVEHSAPGAAAAPTREPRIFVDCRTVRWDHHDGISRYTVELVGALAKLTPVTLVVNDPRQLAELPAMPHVRVPANTSPLDPLVAFWLNPHHPDVVFTPMQTMGSLARNYRFVVTVHDLIYYSHRTPPRDLPGFVRALWRLYHLSWWPQRALLNRADAVAVVSSTTKALVLEKRLTHRPILLVPNASSLEAPDAPPSALPRTDLIYMGSFMPYKNVEVLVRGMAELPGYTLHVLSRITPQTKARLQVLAEDARVVFHGGVSDARYVELLAGARALVTASLDEGFGIPLVEAMRLGVPVVVSDIPIFHEIAGSAGTFFDPRDPAAFARAVLSLDGEARWRTLAAASLKEAARWSWDVSAANLLAGLNRVLDAHKSPDRRVSARASRVKRGASPS